MLEPGPARHAGDHEAADERHHAHGQLGFLAVEADRADRDGRAVAQRAPETLMVVLLPGSADGGDDNQASQHRDPRRPAALQPPLTGGRPDRPAGVPGHAVPDAAQRGAPGAAVVAGVLLAIVLSAFVGFTWWSLGLTIAVGLAVGYALRLGDPLEVPISAMLILSVGTIRAAAMESRRDAVRSGSGPARRAVFAWLRPAACRRGRRRRCARTMAGLLADMAAGLWRRDRR